MSRGPNAALVGEQDAAARLATPCLLLTTGAFEHNLAAMMALVRRYGRQLRPHVKAHKCTAIARRQLDAGAVGLCCATVRAMKTIVLGGGVIGTATAYEVARLGDERHGSSAGKPFRSTAARGTTPG